MRKSSSVALALAFLMPLAGCPGDGGGSTGTGSETGVETGAETGTPTTGTSAATETSGTTTGMTTDATATGSSSGGGGSGGFCALACKTPADCANGGNEADWACTDGFCEYLVKPPACDPATCDDVMVGVCAEVGGTSLCTTPCTDDSMCVPGFTECTGVDDGGNSICVGIACGGVAEGAPCEIQGFGQLGTCTDGVCVCSDNSECTAMGYSCKL